VALLVWQAGRRESARKYPALQDRAGYFRFPLAAALLSKQLEGDENAPGWRVESAGTWGKSGLGVPAFTLEAHRTSRRWAGGCRSRLYDRIATGNKKESRFMATVSIEIPGEVIHATRMTPDDLKQELAIHLFREGKLSFGKARELAGLTVWEFQNLLGSRKTPVHYGLKEYEDDLNTLKDMGHLP
jgi:predicted HTH domain antitoxin